LGATQAPRQLVVRQGAEQPPFSRGPVSKFGSRSKWGNPQGQSLTADIPLGTAQAPAQFRIVKPAQQCGLVRGPGAGWRGEADAPALAHGDHGLDGASGAAGKDGIRRFAKLLQLGQCPVNARAGCQGSGHGVKKEIAGSPFSLFSFAYLAYFAVSSGALGSSLPAATGGGFGFGKFRRDNQPSLRYGSAEQGSLVQKLGDWVHLIRPVAALTRRCAPPSPIRWARDIAQVKRPDHFIGSRFRFFFQNVIFHIHFS
jgi:hypothetical protein